MQTNDPVVPQIAEDQEPIELPTSIKYGDAIRELKAGNHIIIEECATEDEKERERARIRVLNWAKRNVPACAFTTATDRKGVVRLFRTK